MSAVFLPGEFLTGDFLTGIQNEHLLVDDGQTLHIVTVDLRPCDFVPPTLQSRIKLGYVRRPYILKLFENMYDGIEIII